MTDSTPLSSQLLDQLQGAPLEQLAQQLGLDSVQTEQAVGAALPMMLGVMGQKAAQPEGADALFGALQRDHAGGGMDLGGLLGSLLGGGAGAGAGGGALDGAGILGHIFGGNQSQAETGLGQATGLGGGQAGQLLQLLAPIVMSFLAQRVSAGGLSAGALGQTLGRESAQVQQQGGLGGGLLGSLLDQDGDGQLGLSDLLKVGGSFLSGRR